MILLALQIADLCEYREVGEFPDRNVYFEYINSIIFLIGRSQYSGELVDCSLDEGSLCPADLSLDIRRATDSHPLGSDDLICANVLVENLGPNQAHHIQIFMTLPSGTSFNSTEVIWSTVPIDEPKTLTGSSNSSKLTSYTLQFDITDPLPQKDYISLNIYFSIASNEVRPESYHFSAKVNSSTADEDIDNNAIEKDIRFPIDAKLTVKGRPIDKPILYAVANYVPMVNATGESQIGPKVVFNYDICNEGKTPINEAKLFFLWPNNTADGDPVLYYSKLQPRKSPNILCEPASDINESESDEKSENSAGGITESTWDNITSVTPDDRDGELARFLHCTPRTECSLMRCVITNLRGNSCADMPIEMRLAAHTMESVRK